MRIGITGATGFVGKHVAAAARAGGHRVIAFSRTPRPDPAFDEVRAYMPVSETDVTGLDAVIHLAGESIAGLWTARRKKAIRDSRVLLTVRLIDRLRAAPEPPRVFLCASGIAWYGDQGDAELMEESPPGDGFLAEVSRAWEAAAHEASDFARVVSLRTGLALGGDGGGGPLLRRVFRLGLGGRLGSGKQWMSWIHVQDLARLYIFAAEYAALRGPVNAVAPAPVTNRVFTSVFASAAHRPALFPAPSFVLSRLPGGMGEMFLQSQRARPAAALAAGFAFLYPDLHSAARDLFS